MSDLKTDLQVTIAGETRTVTFSAFRADSTFLYGDNENLASARIGQGAKRHPVKITAVRLTDETNARVRAGYRGKQLVTDAEGNEYGIQMSTAVLNRQARITGWFVKGEARNSQHNGEMAR